MKLLCGGLVIFLSFDKWITIFFKIDVKTAVKNLFLGTPEVDIQINPEAQYEGNKKNNEGDKKQKKFSQ